MLCKTLVEILCELSSIVTDNASGSEKSTARRNIVLYCCRPRTDFTTHSIGSVASATAWRIKHRVLLKESLSLDASIPESRHGSDVQFITILNSAQCILKRNTPKELATLSGTTVHCHIQNFSHDSSTLPQFPMSLLAPTFRPVRSSMCLTSINITHIIRRHIPEDGYVESSTPVRTSDSFHSLLHALLCIGFLCDHDVYIRNGTTIQEDQVIC